MMPAMEVKQIKRAPWRPETIAHKVFSTLRHMMAKEGYEPLAADSDTADELIALVVMAVKNALAKGLNIPAEAAADPGTQLKTNTTDS